jgi:hypothetical protein
MGNQEWTILRNWQQDEDKQNEKHNTICVGYHYAQTNTNNVNKTWFPSYLFQELVFFKKTILR